MYTNRLPYTTACRMALNHVQRVFFGQAQPMQTALDLLYVDAATRMEGWKLSKFKHCNLPSRITSHVRFRLLVSESSADGAQEVSLSSTAHPNSAVVKVTSCEAAKTLKVVLPEEIRLVKLMFHILIAYTHSFLFILGCVSSNSVPLRNLI